MLSTSLSQDLYRRFIRPSATDADVLRVARWAAVGGGVLGTGLAIVSESIVGALSFFYTLLTVSLFVPVIAGLYLRRLSSPEALASIAGGVTFAAVVQIASAGQGLAGLTPAMFGLGGAALGWALVSAVKTRSGS
jgi:SSS family solute:Na+ symporter